MSLRKKTDSPGSSYTVTCDAHFEVGKRGRKKMAEGKPSKQKPIGPGRIARISKLIALAIHYDGLLNQGVVRDYAEIARLGGVSRARVTQIMNLLLLAPEIQERLLFIPKVYEGKDPATEHEIREVAKVMGWEEQLKMWKKEAGG